MTQHNSQASLQTGARRLPRNRKRSSFDKLAQSLADSMTSEEYIRLIQRVAPIAPDDPIRAMTDDELLAELQS